MSIESIMAPDVWAAPVPEKAKRVARVKSLKAPQPVRNMIYLRPIKKAYIANKRFRVSLDLMQVAYVLRNGNTITTEFVELPSLVEANRLPEAQTYLQSENADVFTLAHTTTLFKHVDLDYVNVLDADGTVVFCQEYGGSYR